MYVNIEMKYGNRSFFIHTYLKMYLRYFCFESRLSLKYYQRSRTLHVLKISSLTS